MSGQTGNPSIGTTIVVSALTSALITVATLVGVQRYSGEPAVGLATAPAAAAEVGVPEIVRMTRAGADEVLQDRQLKLVVAAERPDPAVPKGNVLQQTPLAGSRVATGSTITVVISSGVDVLAVPTVIGLTLAQATASVAALGLTLGPVVSSSEGPEGTVVNVTPAQGTAVALGQIVILTVASSMVVVPDLIHIPSRTAREKLRAAGLNVGRVRERYDEGLRAYMVLEQNPTAGTKVESGTKVHLVVNEGD